MGSAMAHASNDQSVLQEGTVSKSLTNAEFDSLTTEVISETLLSQIGRAVFCYVDLDIIVENIRLLKKRCRNPDIRVIGVVKGNACGHGAVPVSRHLEKVGAVDRMAVANIPEAIQLRRAGVGGVLQVLGNTQPWAMDECIQYQLVPTVASEEAIRGMSSAIERYKKRIREESIELEEKIEKNVEEIKQIKEMLDQLTLQGQLNGISAKKLPQPLQNGGSNDHKGQDNDKLQLLSSVCNERIAQLQNKIERLRQNKQRLGYLETNNISSIDVKSNQGFSHQSVNSHTASTTLAHEQSNSNIELSKKQAPRDISGVKRNVGVTTNANSDITLRYTSGLPVGTVHLKVDTGMSRNGCQPQELDSLIQVCKDAGVHLEGIFTHICNHEDPIYSKYQVDTFRECTKKHSDQGLIFHVSNSGSVLYDIGTDMTMIRPGLAIFGMSPGMDLQEFSSLGFRPAMMIKGTPTLVKRCQKGTKVGYGCTYTCPEDEWIATFPIGYADGLCRDIGKTGLQYVIRDRTGEKCSVVGRISMDAITVRVPEKPTHGELFTLISADYDPISSISGMSRTMESIEHETLTRLSARLPRVYKHRTSSNVTHSIWPALDLELTTH